MENVFQFITDYFSKGKFVLLDFDMGVNTVVYGKDNLELRALGIEYIEVVEENGWIYKYRYYIGVRTPLYIWLKDYEPDTYQCNCFTVGRHYINFDSTNPGVQ